ncbi:hypothetical protein BASA50_007570 [Batrachochytrium salamandrivorans]|uniref:Uncharacterized protein n=1 Tax=Batrachochytrium salamandrivorans TaxID=1357716 RepID=A0ABQ8F743_9FUNG|nr:hypothetical protein BASA50_010956 [Batrachochytrium salamandrivorans]KAH6593362.1 hypothetical protein BASA50_007570 [Batrachochytrium salamandrivorans]
MDTSYDEQLKYQEYSTLKIGDAPLTSGYHADLLSTLRHEAPVLCVGFTCNSELVALSDTNVDQSTNSIGFMVGMAVDTNTQTAYFMQYHNHWMHGFYLQTMVKPSGRALVPNQHTCPCYDDPS